MAEKSKTEDETVITTVNWKSSLLDKLRKRAKKDRISVSRLTEIILEKNIEQKIF